MSDSTSSSDEEERNVRIEMEKINPNGKFGRKLREKFMFDHNYTNMNHGMSLFSNFNNSDPRQRAFLRRLLSRLINTIFNDSQALLEHILALSAMLFVPIRTVPKLVRTRFSATNTFRC